jgi:hypothetical protein
MIGADTLATPLPLSGYISRLFNSPLESVRGPSPLLTAWSYERRPKKGFSQPFLISFGSSSQVKQAELVTQGKRQQSQWQWQQRILRVLSPQEEGPTTQGLYQSCNARGRHPLVLAAVCRRSRDCKATKGPIISTGRASCLHRGLSG